MTSEPTMPDEALLQAYLDDELAKEDRKLVETRLAAEPAWREALQELEDAADLLSRGLVLQDSLLPASAPPPWIGVLKRRAARTATKRFPMRRAAAVTVLLVGAVASGLPGSPVREWFADRSVATAAPTSPTAIAAPEGDDEAVEVGVRVGTPDGTLEVILPELPPGAELWVRLDAEAESGVFGPTGTQFRTRDGRVDVLNPTGVIRVEVPSALNPLSILVGDVVYLRRSGARLELGGPVTEQSDVEVRFGTVPPDAP